MRPVFTIMATLAFMATAAAHNRGTMPDPPLTAMGVSSKLTINERVDRAFEAAGIPRR